MKAAVVLVLFCFVTSSFFTSTSLWAETPSCSTPLQCGRYALKEYKKGNGDVGFTLAQKACETKGDGQQNACNIFGAMEETKGNISRAEYFYKAACALGHEQACSNVVTIKRTKGKDLSHHHNLCLRGMKTGKQCYKFGLIEYGVGRMGKARALFKKACDLGYARGCSFLAETNNKNSVSGVSNNSDVMGPRDFVRSSIFFYHNSEDLGKGNPNKTKASWKKSCDSGERDSCYSLGFLEEKQGNIPKASALYERACNLKHTNGCFYLGVLEEDRGNVSKSKTFYKRACLLGEGAGCHHFLRMMGETGDTLSARKLWKKSCSMGSARGCVVLGDLEKDKGRVDQARVFYKKACDSGDSLWSSCVKLDALQKERGKATLKNRGWFFKPKIASNTHSSTCSTGAECFNFGFQEHEKGKMTKASFLFKKACDLDHGVGCFNLGVLEEKKGNRAKAGVLWKKSCDLEVGAGCYGLGFLEYKKGNIVKASALYKKACDLGYKSGCFNLGILEEDKGNVAKASALYKKACDLGHGGGCFNLGLLEKQKSNGDRARRLFQKAKKLLNKQCDGGDNHACKTLMKVGSHLE